MTQNHARKLENGTQSLPHDHDNHVTSTADTTSDRGRRSPSPPLQISKSRSTRSLGLEAASASTAADDSEKSRARLSLDIGNPRLVGVGKGQHDVLTRTPIMADHDHGLGLSGLRRIRQQHNPDRSPTLLSFSTANPSAASTITRTASMATFLSPGPQAQHTPAPLAYASPSFTEDLSRFPSESLHSFSFANQSEGLLHSRQNVLKRSIDFMKDRMGLNVSSNAALASAHARALGDVEAQNMLDLLARANLVGAGNLPSADPEFPTGPLTGPAHLSGDNVFDQHFAPRSSSPEQVAASLVFSTTFPAPETPQPDRGPAHSLSSSDRTASPTAGLRLTSTADPEADHILLADKDASPAPLSTAPARPCGTLKRTMTDTLEASMQQKLMDTLAKPYISGEGANESNLVRSPTLTTTMSVSLTGPSPTSQSVHGHSNRWAPAAQAIFTTEASPPWTILAANDLACLVFGVTKAQVRKMGILEVVQEERRGWLEKKLQKLDSCNATDDLASVTDSLPPASISSAMSWLGNRASAGITAKLLSKPNSRALQAKKSQQKQQQQFPPTRGSQTFHSGDANSPKPRNSHHRNSRSRGVLLCGDVVPIQKRNGATGSASLWVKEKRIGLIWVLEEIQEDVAHVVLAENGIVTEISGASASLWGAHLPEEPTDLDIGTLIPRIPRQGIDPRYGDVDYAELARRKYFTCRNGNQINIPATVEQVRGKTELRVSSFMHMAGIVVVSPDTLRIQSSNPVFCGALFGYERPNGLLVDALVPHFGQVLSILTEEEQVSLADGIVVPEHSFRKASALLALREKRPGAAAAFLRPEGLPARHRDGSELRIDVQMRVVKSEKRLATPDDSDSDTNPHQDRLVGSHSELVYALWITYSRHLHANQANTQAFPAVREATPLHQPSPGQSRAYTPLVVDSNSEGGTKEVVEAADAARPSSSDPQPQKARDHAPLGDVSDAVATDAREEPPLQPASPPAAPPASRKKTVDDFEIIEDMGQGAYGQVKLACYKDSGQKVVLKYVTKRRILVDTWTRDRQLGTIPLEIHVLNYLRRQGLRHPNIVEMEDFFEDETNYYLEMIPHGHPGMDLFDYIELRTNMDEDECQSIFVQVARAIHHLHTKAMVVHRDIKDENIVLDGEGNIKLIDFGSAAYRKSGPFDVFVGTIDYAAPEVLAGQRYYGTEQDVWALGILLYTIVYKENPFYSIDEIIDRDLRVPYVMSDESIDLIRKMLERDVTKRYTIEQVLTHPWCRTAQEE